MRQPASILIVLTAALFGLGGCYGSGTLCPGANCFAQPEPDADFGDADGEQIACHPTCDALNPCCSAEVCSRFVDDDPESWQGICVPRPGEEAVTRDNPDLPGDQTNVDLSCIDPDNYPDLWPATPTAARLEGCVDAFGLGFDTRGLKVEVFRMEPDGSLGTKLGETTSESDGYYRMTSQLPTNSLLVTKVSGQGVKDTYKYNIQIPAGLVSDGVFYDNAFVISKSTWAIITRIACQCNVEPEFGIIAGTIRDCSELAIYENERPSCVRTDEHDDHKILKAEDWAEIKGARMAFLNQPADLVYFNGNEDDLAPIPVSIASRDHLGTNIDGTYATLDTPVGINLIGGSILHNGQVTSIGALPVEVFPDSVSLSNLVVWGHPTTQ